MTLDELLGAARAWAAGDPDPETRAAALDAVERRDEALLRDCFGSSLQFGTAGLRGALGPGPNRMNRAVVRRASAGLADHLCSVVPDARERGVVVGFDGRIGSREFAADAARVIAARGLPAFLHGDLCPTPQLAHAVVHLGAAAGVMVTASHNPPQDNGYKVYWGNGAQIVPPHDSGIRAAIDALAATPDAPADAPVRAVAPEVLGAYLDGVLGLRVHREAGIRVAYTAMHGVGCALFCEVFRRAGHAEPFLVAQQCEPDGRFPTVRFPNPEEPGALDLALARAREVDADLVVANDPDADRLAVAVRRGPGDYRVLTGNQVGALLGADLLEHGPRGSAERAVAASVVSSTLLSRIARAHGAVCLETLTGFKWIANAGLAHAQAGGEFVMGYEEALGYTVSTLVRDKDGISAALLLADLASFCKARGETLLDRLADVYRRHGCHAERQKSVVLPGAEGAARIRALMTRLRESPPPEVSGARLVAFRDLERRIARDLATGETRPETLPKSDVLSFSYGEDVRVLARPSGTEPKIKFYFEVREPMGSEEPLSEAEARAQVRLERVMAAFLGPLGVG